MGRYLINRILWIIPVLWLIATVTFILMNIAPGSPWDYKASQTNRPLSEAQKANLDRKYGLDKPVFVQYTTYLANAVRLDFGESYQYQGQSVFDMIKQGLPYSARLGLFAFLISVAIGVPLGILAALKQNTWIDYVALFAATAGFTIPSFVIAIFLLVLFAVRIQWFDVLWTESWKSYVLPAVALGIGSSAFLARLTRASMLEVMRQDYIRTARAKGLPGSTVTFRHIVRNGLIPVVTVMGPALAGLITGTFIIEFIFQVPGIGRLFIQAVNARDYPVIMGSTLLFAFFIAVGNLAVDIIYGLVDPRIKAG